MALSELLEHGLIIEARALLAARIDELFLGAHEKDGGSLGSLVVERYKPRDYEHEPFAIKIIPVRSAPVLDGSKTKQDLIIECCEHLELLVKDGIKDGYTFADVAAMANSSHAHVWEVLNEKVPADKRREMFPHLSNTRLNKEEIAQ